MGKRLKLALFVWSRIIITRYKQFYSAKFVRSISSISLPEFVKTPIAEHLSKLPRQANVIVVVFSIFLFAEVNKNVKPALVLLGLALLPFIKRRWGNRIIETSERFVLRFSMIGFSFYFLLQSPLTFEFSSAYFYVFGKFAMVIALFYILFSKKSYPADFWSLGFLLCYWVDYRLIVAVNEGITKTSTEWFSIWEGGMIFAFLIALKPVTKLSSNQNLALFALIHFANYLAAGVAKLDIGGVDWVLHNDTLLNFAKISAWGLGGEQFEFFLHFIGIKALDITGNSLVLISQLSSALLPIFPILFLPLSIAYDIFHVAVALLAGVVFYKWVVVNVALACVYRSIISGFKSFGLKLNVTLTVFLYFYCQSPTFIPLGWFDAAQGNVINFEVTLKDGRREEVMSTVFGSAAFPMGHKFVKAFERSYGTPLFSAGDMKEKILKDRCEYEIQRDDSEINDQRTSLESVILQTFDRTKSDFEILMHNVQPYHQAIPSITKTNYLSRDLLLAVSSVTVSQRGLCFDKSGRYRETFKESFTVKIP